MDEERLIAIETKIAHQEHLLVELNTVLTDQQRQLMSLESICQSLLERVRSMPDSAAADGNPADERPPHY